MQDGFMSSRSTTTSLLCIMQDISVVLETKGQMDVVYTDLLRAFDTIDHGILLKKLDELGFHANLLRFLSSYLQDRRNFVRYNGFTFWEYKSSPGVPQGSNLVPLLSVLFMNDLFVLLSCSALAYADDLKVYQRINNVSDAIILQKL